MEVAQKQAANFQSLYKTYILLSRRILFTKLACIWEQLQLFARGHLNFCFSRKWNFPATSAISVGRWQKRGVGAAERWLGLGNRALAGCWMWHHMHTEREREMHILPRSWKGISSMESVHKQRHQNLHATFHLAARNYANSQMQKSSGRSSLDFSFKNCISKSTIGFGLFNLTK